MENEETGEFTIIIKLVDPKTEESDVKKIVEVISGNNDISNAILRIKIFDENNNEVKQKSDDGSNTAVIVAVVVVVVVVAIAVFIAVLAVFFMMRKRKQTNDIEMARRAVRSRVVEKSIETEDASSYNSAFKHVEEIYPKDYKPPQSIKEALMNAGMNEEDAEEVDIECIGNAELLKDKGLVTEEFNVEDAAAVALYTFDFGKDGMYEMNPYRLLNKALSTKKKEEKAKQLVKVRDVLYLVMCALRKLPAVKGVTLYRGIRDKVDMNQYKEGSTVTWPGFSSTTPDMNTTKAFLTNMRDEREGEERDGGEDETTMKGTLFVIEEAWGYDVQPYSIFSDEEEILLEPERVFEVTSVVDSDEFVMVTLKMLNTPLILTKVFGESKH